jgi:hypothetical protein
VDERAARPYLSQQSLKSFGTWYEEDFAQKVTSIGARGRLGQIATSHRGGDERERGSQRKEGAGGSEGATRPVAGGW